MYGGSILATGPDMDTTAVKWDPNLAGQRHTGTPLRFLHASVTTLDCNCSELFLKYC